jgi:CheY-like chemotaxis protein
VADVPTVSEQRRVLIIDDDEEFAQLLSVYLARAGYRTTIAHDGIQGQRLARLEQPDVITIDYHMPGGSGAMIASRIRSLATTAAIPIVMLTGVPSNAVISEAKAAGVSEVLSKLTLTQEALAEALEKALEVSQPDAGSFEGLFPSHAG